MRCRPLIAAVLLLLTARQAAAARTDVIVLLNGDRFTGEVTQLRQGKLQVKTDDAGTLSIEWDKIASVTTAAMYDVTLRDGRRLLGRLRPAAGRSLDIVLPIGPPATIAMDDVAALDTIKAGFLRRIDGSVDLGGSYTKSSGVAEMYFDLQAIYRRPAYSYNLSFATNLTRQPDAPETSRYSLQLGYTRARDRWYVSTFGLFESNRELGFTFRGTGAMSLGRYVARTPHAELLLGGGLAGGSETPIDRSAAANVDGLLAADLSVFTYDYPTTRIDFGVLVFPSFDDPGRVRVNADAKFKREIFRDFFVSLTAYDAFDNRPKASNAQRNDFGGSLSFGWSF